jgi:hypothetical protein
MFKHSKLYCMTYVNGRYVNNQVNKWTLNPIYYYDTGAIGLDVCHFRYYYGHHYEIFEVQDLWNATNGLTSHIIYWKSANSVKRSEPMQARTEHASLSIAGFY